MTDATGRRILSGMQIAVGLVTLNITIHLSPLITGTFVEALSGTGLSITTGFGTGVMQ